MIYQILFDICGFDFEISPTSYLLENEFQMGWIPDIMVFQKLHYFHTKSGVPGLPKNVGVLRARLLIIVRNSTYFANF